MCPNPRPSLFLRFQLLCFALPTLQVGARQGLETVNNEQLGTIKTPPGRFQVYLSLCGPDAITNEYARHDYGLLVAWSPRPSLGNPSSTTQKHRRNLPKIRDQTSTFQSCVHNACPIDVWAAPQDSWRALPGQRQPSAKLRSFRCVWGAALWGAPQRWGTALPKVGSGDRSECWPEIVARGSPPAIARQG